MARPRGAADVNVIGVLDRSAEGAYAEDSHSAVIPLAHQNVAAGTLNLTGRVLDCGPGVFAWIYVLGAVLLRALEFGRSVREEAHPWHSSTDVLLEARDRASLQADAALASLAKRCLMQGAQPQFDGRVAAAVILRNAAEVLVPRSGGSGELRPNQLRGATVRLLEAMDVDDAVVDVIRHSCERWDGSGPLGLAGPRIPLVSRVLAACERLLELEQTAGRAQALQQVVGESGAALCPHAVRLLQEAIATSR